jgi:hypothetical protein
MGNINRPLVAGPPCPRCGQPTEVREHVEVTSRELAKAFYYSRWYKCANNRCKTTLIMPKEFRVFHDRNIEPSQAAVRMRRSRKRRRDGLRLLRVELRETEIDALVDKGLLKPDARNNRNAVLMAIYGFFERHLEDGL